MRTHEHAPDSGGLAPLDRHSRQDSWHAIDFEDIAISREALEAIKRAARQILPNYVPAPAMRQMTLGDSISLLSRKIFWEEGSGRLLLCSHLGGREYCMDIPPEHWRLHKSHADN